MISNPFLKAAYVFTCDGYLADVNSLNRNCEPVYQYVLNLDIKLTDEEWLYLIENTDVDNQTTGYFDMLGYMLLNRHKTKHMSPEIWDALIQKFDGGKHIEQAYSKHFPMLVTQLNEMKNYVNRHYAEKERDFINSNIHYCDVKPKGIVKI